MSEHEHNAELSGKRFFEVTVLNAVITIVEFLGGIFSGSLSLLSDAIHNLGDSLSIIFSYGAHVISQRKQTKTNTYGFKRAQILSALFNSGKARNDLRFFIIDKCLGTFKIKVEF